MPSGFLDGDPDCTSTVSVCTSRTFEWQTDVQRRTACFLFFSSPDPLVSRAVVTAIKKGMKCTTKNIINSYVSLIYCFYNKAHIYNILSGSGVADLCIILITKLPPRPHAACSRRKIKNGELSKRRSYVGTPVSLAVRRETWE